MFQTSNDFSGMICANNEHLIKSCEKVLQQVSDDRVSKRQEMIDEKFDNMIWWWNNLYRFFFFPLPTKEKAEAALCWRDFMSCDIYGWEREGKCKKLISAAKRNPDPVMWITVESANFCKYSETN